LKPLITAATISGFFAGLWLIGKATSALRVFRVDSAAGQPTLKPGRFFFTSNLKRPRRFSLIHYRTMLAGTGLSFQTHRLCGLPGDTLEIKGGTLYVNGVNADDQLDLMHTWKILRKDSGSVVFHPQQSYTIPPYSDTLYVSLADKYMQSNLIPCERYILPAGLRDDAIFRVYKRNWNQDNFGPVRVPAGRWFVLGDNRNNAMDSRHLGFIEQSKYIGTVLWK
jgi:signal peptidase I